MIRLVPYSAGSESGAALAAALKIKRTKLEGADLRWKKGDALINWGISSVPRRLMPFPKAAWLNHPDVTCVATNKLEFFKRMTEAKLGGVIPQWTTDIDEAKVWALKGRVIGRRLLNAAGGRGIFVYSKQHVDIIQALPLYTRYRPKIAEYRLHIVDGIVIAVQQKLRNGDRWNGDNCIRNAANGWVYTTKIRDPITKELSSACLQAMEALHLDYGAVDVGWTAGSKKATVYEINTAPGLEDVMIETWSRRMADLIRVRFGK